MAAARGAKARFDQAALASVAALLGTPWSAELAAIPALIDALGSAPAPFAAATVLAEVLAVRPDAELLAWWLADLMIARQLRWPAPVPLMIGQIHTDAFRSGNRRGRIAPGGEGFERAVCLALAQAAAEACRLATEMARRAGRLAAAAPKLRAKGPAEAIQMLLDDDAVSGSLTTTTLSRWGSRRLFDRLAALEAARELTGRSTFRSTGFKRWAAEPKPRSLRCRTDRSAPGIALARMDGPRRGRDFWLARTGAAGRSGAGGWQRLQSRPDDRRHQR